MLEVDGRRLATVGCSDHPREFAAGPDTPGIAYADFRRGADWLPAAIAQVDADAVS